MAGDAKRKTAPDEVIFPMGPGSTTLGHTRRQCDHTAGRILTILPRGISNGAVRADRDTLLSRSTATWHHSAETRPRRSANLVTAWALCRSSFCIKLVRWLSTVLGERWSKAAISRLVLPSATS